MPKMTYVTRYMTRMLPWLPHEQGHLLDGVHDARVLHEQEEVRHRHQIGRGQVERRKAPDPLLPRASTDGRIHLGLLSLRAEARRASRPDTYGVDLRCKYDTYAVSLSRGLLRRRLPVPTRPTPSPESREPLSRERVLGAAVLLADEDGLESLTMRKLGLRLGVEAMSLYNHVANKDDLLDGMVDLVVSEIDLPSDAVDWKEAMRREGDLGPGGLLPSPVGERSDRLTREQRTRAAALLRLGDRDAPASRVHARAGRPCVLAPRQLHLRLRSAAAQHVRRTATARPRRWRRPSSGRYPPTSTPTSGRWSSTTR